MAETAGRIDPDAGAEAIFWEIHVTDTFNGKDARSEVKQYLRIKIYNDRGRDSEAHVEIPYFSGESIEDIAGRTIRPDGSTVELKKDAIFDRTTVKISGFKGKTKSFALPAITPGCVLEYQWSTVRRLLATTSFPGQRSTPVRQLTYYVTPLSLPDVRVQIRGYNGAFPPPVTGADGARVITLSRIEAIRDEPFMPPADQVRPWLVLQYTEGRELSTNAFWSAYAKEQFGEYERSTTAGPTVKARARALTDGVPDFDRQVKVLHDYCRTQIRNLDDDAHGFTDGFRETNLRDKERTPEKTLKSGLGTSMDINNLFAALAASVGFEARVALVGNRSLMFFNRDHKSIGELSGSIVAIRVMGVWRFSDPADAYVPCGMLPWWEENQEALILDPEHPRFVSTPLSPPTSSCLRRKAWLRLDENGSLEGNVSIEYTGHLAAGRKEDLDELSAEKREEVIRNEIHERWASASASDVRLMGVADPLIPLTLSYHLTIPDYAERAGKRLLIQPCIFQRGTQPTFSASTRRNELYFPSPWSEEDSVSIELPAGYKREEDSPPGPIVSGRTLAHGIEVDTADQRTLRFRRTLMFGADGSTLFPVAEYTKLKGYFDAIHDHDGYTMTLTQLSKGPAGE